MTRLNVYAGPAGFYLIRGGPAGDKAVLDSRTGVAAVLPGPSPKEGDKFPPNKTHGGSEHDRHGGLEDRSTRSAQDILAKRFARGEISEEEFEQRRRVLEQRP